MGHSFFADLRGQTAVVTGGAKGIGEACVRGLAEQGAQVALFDQDERAALQLADALDHVRAYGVDVSRGGEVRHAFEQVVQELGPPTLLVNNAGVQTYGTVVSTNEEEWDRVIGVNLKSQFLCAREAVPHMQGAGHGAIVNVASVQSFICQTNVVAYATSKTALLGLTRSIAVDFAPQIRCNAVCPGTVDTPMLSGAVALSPDPQEVLEECRAMHLARRIAKAEEIADLVLYLLSKRAGFVTGQAFRIDGGLGLTIGGSKRE